jgi:hypothetical protein
MAGGYLLSPRVRVLWGDINLSAYNGTLDFPQGSPVVYDVEVDLQAEGEGPTGSFKWDPTGPGLAVYEAFVLDKAQMERNITIEFFYPRGKKIVFFFVWSGQSINYGNDMVINVKLQTKLSGLVNANQRNVAQAYDEKKGTTPVAVIDRAKKQFGLEGNDKLIQYNEYSLQHLNKVKLANMYGNDMTFGNAVGQVTKQTGDQAFAHNIQGKGIVVMPPYSYKNKGGTDQRVLNAATSVGAGKAPDPTKRYGYIIGPSIFNTIQREANWKPPQQSNNNLPGTQTKARDARGRFTSTTQNPPSNQQTATQKTSTKTSSPLGTANGRANPGIQNKDNPEGPNRQNALNDEKAATLQMDTLMCPLLVGIKPHDIIFVPNFSGSFMEDWIVQSVGYSQNNGQINVNIRATRIFANSSPMNKTAYDEFLAFAKTRSLVGNSTTPEAWDLYAWGLPG